MKVMKCRESYVTVKSCWRQGRVIVTSGNYLCPSQEEIQEGQDSLGQDTLRQKLPEHCPLVDFTRLTCPPAGKT